MKKQIQKKWKPALAIIILIAGVTIIIDSILLPLYVKGNETIVPNVIGMNKDQAINFLESLNLTPVIQTTRFDDKYGKDKVIFQKPIKGSHVKEGRRVYLTISGGEPLVRVPFIVNKTLRDAQLTLEKAGLKLGQIDSVESELPTNIIVEQQYFQGRELPKGSAVAVKVSLGPQEGMIRVPALIGKSLTEAEGILKSLSLVIGLKTYIHSSKLLPNTIVDQQPSEGNLLKMGDSINVVLTTNKNGQMR
ncbi:MAG: PASTA domain-containing protein [Stygiobacter sp.]|jgi:serine/threonine-protein kinase|uniref:PASTA domain-containing protein n=1 Tax=Stygiobacter electus TaxID=3032292 RepID=A0AAE3P1Q3_9BACT|nr:PASTA domain-containing protein [Stygiobacter electus]MDF1611408.1 PASTA domain-containing protein [Stygiobacter electus]